MSLRDGDPIPCPCGATMLVKFTEPVWSGNFDRKIKAGVRYMYVCDRCRRRCDVRWIERDCLTRRPGDAATRGEGDPATRTLGSPRPRVPASSPVPDPQEPA